MTKNPKPPPTKEQARIILTDKIIRNFESACMNSGIICNLNYFPANMSIETIRLALQYKVTLLYVHQFQGQKELSINNYLNYCADLNLNYEMFGFNDLILA